MNQHNSDFFRTDLAFEKKENENRSKKYYYEGINIIEVHDELGKYITLSCPNLKNLSDTEYYNFARVLSEIILSFCRSALNGTTFFKRKILIAGLGNRNISSDAIGPKVCEKITVCTDTENESNKMKLYSVNMGVFGQTGIETEVLIRGITKTVNPEIIIAIDSLAAASSKNLGSVIQISDRGIFPGSGIGRRKSELSFATMGVPVISIGIPTVIDTGTLFFGMMQKCNKKLSNNDFESTFKKGFFVAPNDCDIITETASSLIAYAVNLAFSPYTGNNI